MRILKAVFIVITGILVLFSLAYADTPARKFSYKQITSDGRHVFVMLGNSDRPEYLEGYTISGLYKNDGSRVPLWAVDWYAPEVEVASDGINLVKYGPWASNQDQEAISFYSKGHSTRSYKISDLVIFPFLMPRSVSHLRWRAYDKLDDKRLLFTLTTLHGDFYAFDIGTGEIVSSFTGSIWFSIVILSSLLLTVLLKRKLFLFIFIMASISFFFFSQNLVFPVVILFVGLWISGNTIAMLNAFASKSSQKWPNTLNRIRRPKFLLVLVSIMLSILIVDFCLTLIKIQNYKPTPIVSSALYPKDLKKVVSKEAGRGPILNVKYLNTAFDI